MKKWAGEKVCQNNFFTGRFPVTVVLCLHRWNFDRGCLLIRKSITTDEFTQVSVAAPSDTHCSRACSSSTVMRFMARRTMPRCSSCCSAQLAVWRAMPARLANSSCDSSRVRVWFLNMRLSAKARRCCALPLRPAWMMDMARPSLRLSSSMTKRLKRVLCWSRISNTALGMHTSLVSRKATTSYWRGSFSGWRLRRTRFPG